MHNYSFKKAVFCFLFFYWLFCSTLPAFASISITASVDKTQISMEDVIELTVRVSGAQDTPEPQMPTMNDFEIQSTGTSSSVQIINGQVNASVSYKYYLTPKKKGDFVIGRFNVRYQGQVYESEPIRVRVTQAVTSSPKESESVFIKAFVSNENPYINEQIVYTFQFFRSIEVRSPQLQLPKFDHFQSQVLGSQKEYRRVINGKNFIVTEVKYALAPTAEGSIVIDPAVLQINLLYRTNRNQRRRNDPFGDSFFDSFFDRNVKTKRKVIRSDKVVVNVLPYPAKGRPSNFQNISGDLTIQTDLSKHQIEEGETTTLTITVSGFGNVSDIKIPDIGLKTDFKIYDDKPEMKEQVHNDRIFTSKAIRKALVPIKSGQILIPEIKIPYFNLKAKRYDFLTTKPMSLIVKPSKEKERLNLLKAEGGPLTKKRKVKMLGKDLLDIHSDLADFSDQRWTNGKITLYGAFFLFPLFSFATLSFFHHRNLNKMENFAYFRGKSAYKNTLSKLQNLKESINSQDYPEYYKNLSKIVREYVGDKLNLEGTALTPQDVEEKLLGKGLKQEDIGSIKHILEACDAAQFGSGSQDKKEMDAMLIRAGESIKALDKEL